MARVYLRGVTRRGVCLPAIVFLLAGTATSYLQTPPVPSEPRAANTSPGLRGGSSTLATVVTAFVWDGENNPVQKITVRLRNVHTGRIEGTAVSDVDGRVNFTDLEGATYVLEVVHANGSLLAAGQVFALLPGETVATFVRLPSKRPWFAGIFNHTAAAAVATAAALGATAVGTSGQPQSPGK